MNDMLLSVRSVSAHPAGGFALGLGLLALLHAAVGLGRARQWSALPLVFGLTALAGFLLNPFADAHSALDLRAALTSYEALTLLCIVQLILVALSFWFGVRMDTRGQDSLSALGIAVLHAIPAPMILVAMLLIEQAQLTLVPGARPEAVGRQVGLLAAATITGAAIVGLLIPRRYLATPHHLLSIALLLACMFVPVLQDPLPRPLTEFDPSSLALLWKFALAALLLIVLGWCARPKTVTRMGTISNSS